MHFVGPDSNASCFSEHECESSKLAGYGHFSWIPGLSAEHAV